jgi:hypothetical protein
MPLGSGKNHQQQNISRCDLMTLPEISSLSHLKNKMRKKKKRKKNRSYLKCQVLWFSIKINAEKKKKKRNNVKLLFSEKKS